MKTFQTGRAGAALGLAAFLAVSAGLQYYAHRLVQKNEEEPRAAASLRGKPAPDFTLPLLQPASPASAADTAPVQGEPAEINLAAYRGQIVIISFWASWCEPCRFELPVLNQFYLTHRGEGVQVIGVSTDDKREEAEHYLRENNFALPMAWDHQGRASSLYQVDSLPTLIVIDREGQLQQYEVGLRYDLNSWLREQVRRLTSKPTAAAGAK